MLMPWRTPFLMLYYYSTTLRLLQTLPASLDSLLERSCGLC